MYQVMPLGIGPLVSTTEPVIAEYPYTGPQDTCAHFRDYLSPIPGTDGTVSGVMAIVEDYTDLKPVTISVYLEIRSIN